MLRVGNFGAELISPQRSNRVEPPRNSYADNARQVERR